MRDMEGIFMNYISNNREVWDKKADSNYVWTRPVSIDEVENAKAGKWNIYLTPTKSVPREWFPESLIGKKVLCIASGGGQQGPIIAAAGAEVTVFDNSAKQLGQDIYVAQRNNLSIKTVQGDMKDLSAFEDETFDFIVHPWSNSFVDTVIPVWKEAYRVLKSGGTLISGFGNPIEYIFDLKELEQGRFVVRHSIPYSDLTSISEDELKELVLNQNEGICFGHSLYDQIQGQIATGFLIAGFYEDNGGSALDQYIDSSIATKAIKL